MHKHERSCYLVNVSKGEETRREILGTALALASEVGLEGLSIGLLAERVGMSKSGLFAHFSSKERLQLAVLDEASQRFAELVILPALKAPRGKPRVVALFERWLAWSQADFMPGGCIFLSSAVELDDRPGAPRDKLVAAERDLQETLAQAVRIAKGESHFKASVDETQFVFELFGIIQSCYFHMRLMRDEAALTRARRAFERLLADAVTRSKH